MGFEKKELSLKKKVIFIILFVIFVLFIYILNTKDTNTISTTKSEPQKTDYIIEFVNVTDPKRYIETEVSDKFKNMMQKCDKQEIYDRLFDEELKAKITYNQFKNYNINEFAIVNVSSNVMANDTIIMTFYDSVNKKGYLLQIKDEKIIQFQQV